ncbi:ATP-dependent helicase [Corynebacterium sp. CCM 9186]|uniref:UvrD-helicase domain-containing protein n=1 Tax=Corynebacterium meridianum TaxID=2765363 RepID=UPI002003BD6B|nr:ATP-dependent helicase [Corynebacterium meridianum]MCK7676817.1 ATP-dependent helicase [Corynebacterium meridianum]
MISPKDWEPADGITLEPNAFLAARNQCENVVITAGPGAGKTELLAQRADFLLTTGCCPYPRRVLAIAFKVDAARNIRERVRRRCGDKLSARFDSFTFHAFAKRIVDNYRVLLKGPEALNPDYALDPVKRVQHERITYDDLIRHAIHILRISSHARNSLRQTYTHVFLDEFQDATGQQYQLLKEAFLNGPTILTAVGDTKQRIMKFAGAVDEIMDMYAVDFRARSLTLYQNFRSAPVLRRMQNRMVQVMEPSAAVSMSELSGEEGSIKVWKFGSSHDEAKAVSDQIETWLNSGVMHKEIAILVRQQPHLVCAELVAELSTRDVPSRNEQSRQDLTAEPAAHFILSSIRVLAGDRSPAAYEDLMRFVTLSSPTEESALRKTRAVSRFLARWKRDMRPGGASWSDAQTWRALVANLIELVTMSAMSALSPEYQRGPRLAEIIAKTLDAFEYELKQGGGPVAALRRLSEEDAIRILTIHKCKGLEFEKVIVLGVEKELFWNKDPRENRAEFFVAISRAKHELILTSTATRQRPPEGARRWEFSRHAYDEFLNYADDSVLE